MNLKKSIVCGRHVKALEQVLGLPMLHVQCLLGLYAPTISKMCGAGMLDEPINRNFCGAVRFIYRNWPDFFEDFSSLYLFQATTLKEIIEVNERKFTKRKVSKPTLINAKSKSKEPNSSSEFRNRITINDTPLDLKLNAHLGIVTFRGYGAARNMLNGSATISLQLTQWFNVIHYCLLTGQAHLVEEVILEEAEAHGLDLDMLLASAWPTMKEDS